METREYFEKVMQDYNQNRNGRSLRKYCKDEAVDYNWLMEFKKTFHFPLLGGGNSEADDLGGEGAAVAES